MWETPVWFLHGKIPWRRDKLSTTVFLGFPAGSAGKESACNAGDLGSIPGLGRSPEEGNSYAFQYSGLENPMDRGAWQATVHGSQRVRHDWANFTFTFKVTLVAQLVKNLPELQQTQVQLLGWEYPLKKEMATHSSILAWKNSWTEEPGRLWSMVSQKLDMA